MIGLGLRHLPDAVIGGRIRRCLDLAQASVRDALREMPDTEVIGMVGKTRDRIVVESEKVGQPAREGDILEVIEASYGTRYRVIWDDGHESTFRPAAGSARVIPAQKRRAK